MIWFKNREVREVLLNLLRARNISWVITDTPGIQDVKHQNITSSEVMIRCSTIGFHPKDLERFEKWSAEFKKYADAGVKDIYFFIHERDEWLWRQELEKMIALNPELNVKALEPLPVESEQLNLF